MAAPIGMVALSELRSPIILFGGDVMLGRGVNSTVRKEGPAHPFGPLRPATRHADLFLANLECAISPDHAQYSGPPKAFYFRADPIGVDVLTHAGIGLVSLANNHALDADRAGLRDTLALLDSRNIAHAGAGEDLEAAQCPAIVQVSGVRLGLLSCCDHQADFAAGQSRPGIWYLDLAEPDAQLPLLDAVEALADQVDHVVVAVHWQPNWAPVVPECYRQLARLLVEAGARVVWGHSPHHFQGVEWIGNGVALYATGDLVTDYAIDRAYRNDRQLLFELSLEGAGVTRVRAFPIELAYGMTQPAARAVRGWIESRFADVCLQVGSRVIMDDEWLRVVPGGED
ncbi:MAG: CapA family protein [Gemmatimonadales bacterium]|nr:CapA family protein [Gemmatimonadales bacterium]